MIELKNLAEALDTIFSDSGEGYCLACAFSSSATKERGRKLDLKPLNAVIRELEVLGFNLGELRVDLEVRPPAFHACKGVDLKPIQFLAVIHTLLFLRSLKTERRSSSEA
jgi:hypothetical protein